MAENPLLGSACWLKPNPGPLAREALDVIGLPSDVSELRIEMSGDASGNRVTVNGHAVTPADALLVRNAAVCDPVRIGAGAPPERPGVHAPGPHDPQTPQRHRGRRGVSEVDLVDFECNTPRCQPAEPGWYATVHGWEIQEGASGGTHYWDGKRWLYENGTVAELPILVFARLGSPRTPRPMPTRTRMTWVGKAPVSRGP